MEDNPKEAVLPVSPPQAFASPLLITAKEARFRLTLKRLYYSSYSRAFYSLMIILTLVLIFISIFDAPAQDTENLWYLGLEVAVTLMIFIDLFWRLAMQGCKKYWSTCTNYFDVVVCIASVAGIAIGFFDVSKYGSQVGTTIIIIRASIQFLRLMTLVKNQRAANVENVKLYGSSLLEGHRKKAGKKSIAEPQRDSIQPAI